MLDKQRALIAAGDYVVEGRDIGTVVAPDAPVKAFLTADPAERARRRAAELERRGVSIQQDEVRAAIEQRDLLDSTRSAAPLRQADDAELDRHHRDDRRRRSPTGSSSSRSARGPRRADERRARPRWR